MYNFPQAVFFISPSVREIAGLENQPEFTHSSVGP